MSKKPNKKAKSQLSTQDNIKECTLYAQGMHCASCEVLIEKKLLKHEKVESVDASQANGKVTVFYRGAAPVLEEVNTEFAELGYTFSEKKAKQRQQAPLIGFGTHGELRINPGRLHRLLRILGGAVLLLFVFILFERSGLSSQVSVSSQSSLSTFFLFGLVAGTSSCAALVGGVLLSMSKQWNELYIAEDSNWLKSQPHILFNVGRLVSFAVLGGLLGVVGGVLSLSPLVVAVITIGVAVLMMLLGLQMLEVPGVGNFQLRMPKFIGRYVADETNFQGRYMPLFAGGLTFFLPCGFTIVAQGLALGSGSFWSGALIMFMFALGTLPMLAFISVSSIKMNAKPHLTANFNKVAGILVVFFAIYNFNSQLNVLGLPSLSDIRLGGAEVVAAATTTGDYQVLQMNASASGYSPSRLTVTAGVPIRWEINDVGTSGCTSAIIARDMFEGQVKLERGLNVVNVAALQPGTYKFSCWMGMISGTIVAV